MSAETRPAAFAPFAPIAALFARPGALARAVPGYRTRAQQVEMAERVAHALAERRVLIAEAGTGTGKTFAYLAPALLYGGKVIISTGTKTLQDQLFNRDIPNVRAALAAPATVALLKGRANYVCHYHLARAGEHARLATREEVRHLAEIKRFARVTRTGDKSELPGVPEDASVWPLATSTKENCLGQNCPNLRDCFVMRARRDAQEADVVVVNHHLFFADLVLRDSGVAELLPACNSVIFDEAHQLPSIAGAFFGSSLSSAQVIELARDTRIEAAASAGDFAALPEAAAALEKAARDLRLAFAQASAQPARITRAQALRHAEIDAALAQLAAALHALCELLATQRERSEGLANCHRRAVELGDRLAHWRAQPEGNDEQTYVRWSEVFNQSVHLNATPVSVAPQFRAQVLGAARAWIFTSATLAVGQDFGHYQRQMGLEGADTAWWGSPYDYATQALLYVPPNLPAPNSPAHTQAVVEHALPLIRAAHGRTFLLFTTLRAMREAAELLKRALEQAGLDFPLLAQGSAPRSELLKRFRSLGNAVLVGSHSFWEGVDVRGRALSVVVIDKLPFAPPDDPVVAARGELARRQGGNPFFEQALPEAIINLKQGAGRLIRDEHDRGVLMICDPRLHTRAYAAAIWASLPPMQRTRDVAQVQAFFEPEPIET